MKRSIIVIAVLALVPACVVWAQQSAIYDNAYRGPVNYYGQPQFQPMTQYNQQGMRYGQQFRNDGLLFQGAHAVKQLGNYFWNYLPAPIRGQSQPWPSSYQVKGGYVIQNYVPPIP
jgi:hypothetical protein